MIQKDSFLDRLRTSITGGRQQRFFGGTDHTIFGHFGVPSTFNAEAALDAYGDNVWLYRSVLAVAEARVTRSV